jgi:EAL domain-containing protein (putative c-di-GMP-specific phosphodiesterase class I)/DNA-binding NarL/FixJ family response regulator
MTATLPRPVGDPVTHPILVVDDDPVVRELFGRVLQDAGYDTYEAADGAEALEMLEREQVALILLDSTMPNLDGAGVIRAVRARLATRTLPIILVTAKADLEDRVRGLEAGADDYLAKPVALDELEARVRAQLRIHAAWTQAFDQEATERRAMTAALLRVPGDGSPERTARALVAELTPALGLEALAILTLSPEGTVIPLAVGGSWVGRFRPGHPIPPDLARRLRERTAQDPWVLDEPIDKDERTPRAGMVAALPLEGHAGRFGLLMLRDARGPHRVTGFARRLPLFLELAEITAAVLRPGLEAGEAHLRARAEIENIIATRAFTPNFQPVVTLIDRAVVGYEALTRFAGGVLPDVRFAEATRLGLGHELERATLAAAVQAGRGLPVGAHLALNVSPTFVLASMDLSALLAGSGRDIVLEITEHAPVDDYEALRAALGRIEPPVAVSVDDAGSGYASLRHILALRPAYVKLDLSWVRDIDADRARQVLVAGLAHFAAETSCQIIGEGIETEAERSTLLRLGVPLGQGYLFGRAASVLEAGAVGGSR